MNGASFGSAITTGAWTTAFGTFTGVATTTAPSFPLPTTLGGVTVAVEGVNAPVYFVNSTQINFLTPAATVPGVRTLRITTGGGTFEGSIRVISAAPGLFTKSADTPPKGAVLNQNFVENSQATPAARGETIQIYGTGPGAFNAAVVDGAAAPSTPLTTTRSTPQVTIGGVAATVVFTGLAPGFPGLWQVNATIPNLPFLTGKVPVRVFVDGVDSNEVFVFVQ